MFEMFKNNLKDHLTLAVLACVVVALSWLLRSFPQFNIMPVGLAAIVLLGGHWHGPRFGGIVGTIAGFLAILLFLAGAVSPSATVVSLIVIAISTLFPIPWIERLQEKENIFSQRRKPLEEKRSVLKEKLKVLRREAQLSERRSRETDALYHAGREISKLLTLSDTLEFSRQVIRDTLGSSGHAPEEDSGFMFVLIINTEDEGFKVGASGGVTPDVLRAFEGTLNNKTLVGWLKEMGEAIVVGNVSAEPRLKGVAVPPQVRGFFSIPLVIEKEIIGLIIVLDTLGDLLDNQDYYNLKILANQIAIGVEKASLYDKVQRLSITDGLTGLYVHRYFQSRLEEEIRRAERYVEPLSLLMLDIDFFKKCNDTYGHLAGDAVLKRVAALLRENVDPQDIVSRYGGEEFAVILPKQDKKKAAAKAEALRKAVEKAEFTFEGRQASISLSGGLAVFPGDAMTKKGLIDKADQALYRAKSSGRNRIELV